MQEYMEISYDPKRASADAVSHLCAPRNEFVAPTTFPKVTTCEGYAEDHGKLMKQIKDLHIKHMDVLFAKDNSVALRYSAEGSHSGAPHGDIQATGKKAQWTAAALFELTDDGKISKFIKEWNKLAMWEQLGWPIEECKSFG